MKFESFLSDDFIRLLEEIHIQGFKVGIIGGTVRDFLLGHKNQHDYDCELRLIDSITELEEKFKTLTFGKGYIVTKLPYNIIRIEHTKFTCELTLPRIEVFDDSFSHSNFTAHFSGEYDYKTSFSRRDFSINAMMYEFNSTWEFIDPFNGKKDLKAKVLKPCSEAFYKDPVRFLRALRFRNCLGFELDPIVMEKFEEVEIESFSSHYLRYEALKSKKPINFIFDLFEITNTEIDQKYRDFIFTIEKDITNLKKHLSSLLFLKNSQKELLFDAFDFSFKVDSIQLPINFLEMSSLPEDQFCKHAEEVKLVNSIKSLLKLDEVYFSYLVELQLVDINYMQLKKMNSIEVDLEGVVNKKRSTIQLYKRVKNYYGEQKAGKL